MRRVTTGDQAATPITHIRIGMADFGDMVIGAIGRAFRDAGSAKSEPVAPQSPHLRKRTLYQ